MKQFRIALFLALIFVGCHEAEEKSIDQEIKEKTEELKSVEADSKSDNYTFQTTFDMNSGWGYEILNNGELYINQPHIPAVSGNKGFSNELKAAKTAEFVIHKLENNIFPPTISIQELDSLNVLNE